MELSKLMYRVANKTAPQVILGLFTEIQALHNSDTRSRSVKILFPPQARIKNYANWLTTAGIKLWESINQNIKLL